MDVKNEDGDDVDDEDEDEDEGLSNRARKLATRMKIAELKQHCAKPEVVEVWDTTAADPRLLVYLKAYRNTIPVPQHWCQKRKFLQGKRGLEKLPAAPGVHRGHRNPEAPRRLRGEGGGQEAQAEDQG